MHTMTSDIAVLDDDAQNICDLMYDVINDFILPFFLLRMYL